MINNRIRGKRRAAFWRKLGFPNCARARAKLAELREHQRVGYTERELRIMSEMHGLFDLPGAPNSLRDTLPVGSSAGSFEEKRG